MKRSSALFVLAILCVTNSFGQLKFNGKRMVGASIGSIFYNNGSNDVSFPGGTQGYEGKETSYGATINPYIGWFINDETAVGARVNISFNKLTNSYEYNGTTFQKDESSTYDAGLGGFVRKYFSGDKMLPFVQFHLDFGISGKKIEGFMYGSSPDIFKETYDGKSSGGFFTNAGLTGGITKMLNSNVGLDIFAGYRFRYNKHTMKTTTLTDAHNDGTIDVTAISESTSKLTTHGFEIGLGLQIFLEKK